MAPGGCWLSSPNARSHLLPYRSGEAQKPPSGHGTGPGNQIQGTSIVRHTQSLRLSSM